MAIVQLVDIGDNEDASDELAEEAPESLEALGMGVTEATESALKGTLSDDFSRRYYENKRLKPKHMKILRMAVAGYSNNQIAEYMDYTPARVSIILNHQDSLAIMARMVGTAADRLGVSERIKAVAPEMLEYAIGVTRTTHDNKLRSKNAFELLKIAGYSGTTKVEVTTPSAAVNTTLLNRLTSALEESNALQSSAYDPKARALSSRAAQMIAGEVVEVGDPSPSLGEPVSGSLPLRTVPPDSGSRPVAPDNIASSVSVT